MNRVVATNRVMDSFRPASRAERLASPLDSEDIRIAHTQSRVGPGTLGAARTFVLLGW